jgi:hypothetical protein
VDTVTSGDEAAVNAALTAYDALSAGVKAALLPLDRAALEALQTKIAELKAAEAQANQAGANAFKTSHSATLALTADSVTAGNEAAVDAAITAYNALSAGAKALLTAEKTRLDTLKAKIDELNAPADAQAFQTGHGTFLDTDPASLTLGDAAALTTARAAYNALSAPAKDLVAAEYAKLQALEDRMETLTAAQTFKTSHAAALELDPATVTLANETIVDAARAAHDALSADVRALLTAEKALLDSLKAAILLQKTFGSAAITITNGQMEDEDFGLEPLNLYKGDGAAERQAAFVLEAGYTAIRWSVDAADLDWADNETTFVFDAANWSVGNHTLGVTVEKGGRSWSKNISIAVSDGTRL